MKNRYGEPRSAIRSSWAAVERMAPSGKAGRGTKTATEWRR